jgi:type VI secretion system protein ImpL
MNGGAGMIFSFMQRYLFSRLGSTVIGLGCVAALIWYAGPMLGLQNPTHRLAIIGVLVALALLIGLGRWLIARWRGARLQAELSEQVDEKSAERAAEIGAIKEKMDEAIASLKSSELGAVHRGKAALYALPWYMIIGPSAAGKSTLLRQSGLNFPYANPEDLHLKGFGGTRNCDWWFSDQAILLDTAGRYTTEEDDRDEWLTFLQLLRKHRQRMPINGVIVAISIADLLTADSEGLERHVQILRERISELMKQLGLIFPVFIVFTKCDLIHGFEAFFEDLSEHERNQVWGAYLFEAAEEEQADPAALFEGRMQGLYAKLCELRLRKMSMQRNLERKGLLFDFPNQFAAAADRLTEFVHLLFRANPYQETPRFAGVYFSSGTQEGTPLARLVGNLRQAFGYSGADKPARQGQPKPYFVKNLFTDVVFQLQSAVRTGRRRLIWERTCKGLAMASACAILAGAFIVLSGAFARNSLLIDEGAEVVAQLRSVVGAEQPDPLAEYAALETVFEHYQSLLAHKQARPLQALVGIYTGDAQIPALEALLTDALETGFRDRTLQALEYRLENLARQWMAAKREGQERLRESYYHTLRVYLMTAAEPKRLDPKLVAPLMKTLWAQSLGMIPRGQDLADLSERAPAMDAMIGFYLERLPARAGGERAWRVRDELIAGARDQLRTPPNAERLYGQIKSKASLQFKPVRLDDLLSPQNRSLLASEAALPGVFTAKAWHGSVRKQIADVVDLATRGDWVLIPVGEQGESNGFVVDEAQAEQLKLAVRDLYFKEYADAWLDYVASIKPQGFSSLQDASLKLGVLARSDGPIGELMAAVARNVNLTEQPLPKLAEAAQLSERAGVAAPAVGRVEELAVLLADLRRFTNPGDKMTVSELINQYLLMLSGLKSEVERLAASADVQRECQVYAAAVLGSGSSSTQLYKGWVTASSLLNGTDVRTRKAMEGLFSVPVRDVWKEVLVEARRQIEREWQVSVANIFHGQLQGKFPFKDDGPDAALDDVTEFFRPEDGILWSFVQQNLSPFLVEKRSGWQERRWLSQGIGFSTGFLRSLSTARQITGSLFRRGASEPEMHFYVYPMPASGLAEMVLETNGQTYRYRNEPQEWRRFSWPGPMNQIGARISGVVSRGGARAELLAGGQWGLFHLLRKARLNNEGGTVYLTEWELDAAGHGPIKVSFRIRADRQDSVFKQKLIGGFTLPSSLFGGRDFAAGRN